MSKIKNTIPDNYSCNHFMDVDNCVECQYSMQTAHLPDKFTRSFENWYNKKVKRKAKK
tara:strand:- start:591 stop:764 length:174 start_codon:yes stop_codon:yes gene_type:complete